MHNLVAIVIIACLGTSALAQRVLDGEVGRPDTIPTFDRTGVQPRQPFPALALRDLDGKLVPLAGIWRDKPTLLVASSVTCPVSRDNCKPVDAIAARFGDRVNVVVVYTIEAHPVGSPSPYSNREWLTARNVREKILVPEPATIDARIKAAVAYRKRQDIRATMLVDTLHNPAWKSLGGGPNSAAFINTDGTVITRHGWLDVVRMRHEVEHHLDMKRSGEATTAAGKVGIDLGRNRDGGYFFNVIGEDDRAAVFSMLNKSPTLIHVRGGRHGRSHAEESVLHHAVRYGETTEVAHLLLSRGAEVDATDINGETALHLAARRGNAEFVDLLLEHGADAAALSRARLAPVHDAAFNGHHDITRKLLEADAPMDLHVAAGLGDRKEVLRRLRAQPESVNRCDGAGRPAMRYAAANENFKLVDTFLDRNARVDWSDDRQRNAIAESLGAGDFDPQMPTMYYAIAHGRTAIVKRMLNAGADPNRSLSGHFGPPLHMACAGGHVDIVRAILASKNADVDVLDRDERTALHHAAGESSLEVVSLLVTAGADVNRPTGRVVPDPCGPGGGFYGPMLARPLHYAAWRGKLDVAKVLLARGAKVDARRHDGETPLMAAAKFGHSELVDLLIRKGASIDHADKSGDYAIHYAARGEDQARAIATLKVLLRHGADINRPTRHRETPLEIAVGRELDETATFLRTVKLAP